MAYVVLENPTDSFSDIMDYAVYGEARMGSNVDPEEDPQAVLETSSDAQGEYVPWYDVDANGGVSTGSVAVSLDANLATGTDTWSVEGGNQATLTDGPSGGTVQLVEIIAGTSVTAKVSWSNIQVEFLKAGVVQETVNPANAPWVDTRTTGGTLEQIETVQPAASTDDEVIVTGTVRMTCPEGTYPGPDSMFAQAFVFKN